MMSQVWRKLAPRTRQMLALHLSIHPNNLVHSYLLVLRENAPLTAFFCCLVTISLILSVRIPTHAEIYRDKYPSNYRFFPSEGLNRITFYTFLAIVVYMGLNPRDDYFSYWSTDLLFAHSSSRYNFHVTCFQQYLYFCM